MYITIFDGGGFASQAISLLMAQTLAEMHNLKHLHLPPYAIEHCTKQNIEHWFQLFQWDKQECHSRELPPHKVKFVMHFYYKNEVQGRYSMKKVIYRRFKKYARNILNVPPQNYEYEVRVHREGNEVVFERNENIVHVLMDNIIWIDFNAPSIQPILCKKFDQMKKLLREGIQQHSKVYSKINPHWVHVALHVRTGDFLIIETDSIFQALLEGRLFLAYIRFKTKFLYMLSHAQTILLTKRVIKTLEKSHTPYTISIYAPSPHRIIDTALKSAGIEHTANRHIGEDMVDSFARLFLSDIIISQSGGFARLAGILGERLMFFTRSRPWFLGGYMPLLSPYSPIVKKKWSLDSPMSLFRIGQCVSSLIEEKRRKSV